MRILWLTNDLPPRAGGIQQFVGNLVTRVHPADAVIVGPDAGAAGHAHDEVSPVRTVRAPGAVLPTPAIRRLVRDVGRVHRPDVVVLGATWPLGELAGSLRRDLDVPVVGITHGLEAGLARPGLGRLIGRASRDLALVTTITDFTAARLARHVRAGRTASLPPGVDVDRFRPDVDGSALRARWGVPADAPVVGCISRLVPRKGQDVLIRAWPAVRRHHGDAQLVIVGDGPRSGRLRAQIDAGATAGIHLVGPVSWDELPAAYAALDVFAMPCRTRWAGLDVEGLGIVYLEAQATGVPVVAGRSGGAPEAVTDGAGTVVDGRAVGEVAAAISDWLGEASMRAAAGQRGVEAMRRTWSWTQIATRFDELLTEVVAGA